MSKPFQVGVTGGIGSGKSLVCDLFRMFKVPIYSSDQRAKELTNSSPEIKRGIIEIFGSDAIDKNGLPDRALIAKRAFYHPPLLQHLNKLIHPAVAADYENWLNYQHDIPYVIKEAALLIESGLYKSLDYLIVVSAPEKVRVQRVQKRDPHRSQEDIEAIIRRQLPEQETLDFANAVILNIETESVIQQVIQVHEGLLEKIG